MGKIVHKEPKQYLSITEAAAFLGVSRPTIYSQMQSGELPYNQVGARTIRIPLPALVSLQAKQTVTPSKPKLSKHAAHSHSPCEGKRNFQSDELDESHLQ